MKNTRMKHIDDLFGRTPHTVHIPEDDTKPPLFTIEQKRDANTLARFHTVSEDAIADDIDMDSIMLPKHRKIRKHGEFRSYEMKWDETTKGFQRLADSYAMPVLRKYWTPK